ncbi:MAG: thiopurine S-methyltransferase [Steroidobacteraceae bacterium]
MDAQFWLRKWQQNEIGFHQAMPHAALQRHWSRLALPAGAKVFVPLAGKSLDMVWLAAAGFHVIGIELSDIAVRAFFEENNLQPTRRADRDMTCYRANQIELWQGDFFRLRREQLQGVAAIFDRAALIALPADMRGMYVEHLWRLLAPGFAGLVVTLEYEQSQMQGPPFSVLEDEIMARYGGRGEVTRLERDTEVADAARFAARGVSSLAETTYLIRG